MTTSNLNTGIQAPRLGGARAWWVWILANAFVIFLFNVQTGYAIVNPDLSKDLSLTISQVGTVAAVYTWAFAIAQLFGGALLDRLGAGKVLPVAAALVTLGVFIFATAQSYEMLILSQFVIALGSCVGFVGAGYVGGQWFGMAKFGFMFGLVQTIASLSSAFGQAGIELALHSMSWRTLAGDAAIAGVVLVVLMVVFVRNPTPVPVGEGGIAHFFGDVFRAIGEVAKNGQVWAAALVGAMTFGSMLALGVVWAPKILIAHGFDAQTANFAAPLLWVGLAVGSTFINQLSDALKSRAKPVAVAAIIQLLAMVYVVWLSPTTVGAYIALFVFGLANAGHMLAFTAAADHVEPAQIGTASALVNGAMFVAGGLLMSLPGTLLDGTAGQLADYQHAMWVIVGALIIACVGCVLIKESHPEAAGK